MTTTIEPDGHVKTDEPAVLRRFLQRHRAVCGQKIPHTVHLDGQGFFCNLYACPKCGAGVMATEKRYGTDVATYHLAATDEMTAAAERERLEAQADAAAE